MKGIYRTNGFGLLEVLITALVLSIGLLGTAVLNVKSAKLAHKVKHASNAALLANELASSMYANPLEISTGTAGAYHLILNNNKQDSLNFNCSNPEQCFQTRASGGSYWWEKSTISGRDCRSNECWSVEQAIFDIIMVNEKIAAQLPEGRISAFTHSEGEYTLTISWTDPKSEISPSTTVKIPYDGSAFDPAIRIRQIPYALYMSDTTPKTGETQTLPDTILEPWLLYFHSWLDNVRRPVPEEGRYTHDVDNSVVEDIHSGYVNNTQLNSICDNHELQNNAICDREFPDTQPIIIDTAETSSIGSIISPATLSTSLRQDGSIPEGRATPLETFATPAPIPTNGGWSSWSRVRGPRANCGYYTRSCTNPEPEHAGAQCAGSPGECRTHGCQVTSDPVTFLTGGICQRKSKKRWGIRFYWWVCSPITSWTSLTVYESPNC